MTTGAAISDDLGQGPIPLQENHHPLVVTVLACILFGKVCDRLSKSEERLWVPQ